MMLLRLMSWPYIRTHVLRTLLTVSGIVLGVAVLVGMHTANQSVLLAFNQTVDRIAGKTQLQVSAGETGFNEEVLETVQASPSVGVAVPAIEAVVDSGIVGQGNLLILGTDMTGDRGLRDYDLEAGDEAAQRGRVELRGRGAGHGDEALALEGQRAVGHHLHRVQRALAEARLAPQRDQHRGRWLRLLRLRGRPARREEEHRQQHARAHAKRLTRRRGASRLKNAGKAALEAG